MSEIDEIRKRYADPCEWCGDPDDIRTLLAHIERLEKDQGDWRKGMELVASALGEKNPPDLFAGRLADKVLEMGARIEALEAENARLREFFETVFRDVIVRVPADEAFKDEWGADEMYVWAWHPLAQEALKGGRE